MGRIGVSCRFKLLSLFPIYFKYTCKLFLKTQIFKHHYLGTNVHLSYIYQPALGCSASTNYLDKVSNLMKTEAQTVPR